jgi:hypothetical protein
VDCVGVCGAGAACVSCSVECGAGGTACLGLSQGSCPP